MEALLKDSHTILQSSPLRSRTNEPRGASPPLDSYLQNVTSVLSACKRSEISPEDLETVFEALASVLKADVPSDRRGGGGSNGLCSSAIIEACRCSRSLPDDRLRQLRGCSLGLLGSITASPKCANVVSKKELLKLVLQQLLVRGAQPNEEDVRTLVRVAPVLLRGSSEGGGCAPAAEAGASATRYVPPHRRGSDSDFSDSEHDGSRSRSLPYLCLQCLECIDSKLLQPYFIQVFEALTEVLGEDSRSRNLRVIAAKVASKMLEGPSQRSYLAMAELPQSTKGLHRGFTTLSVQLGRLLTGLHATFRAAIQRENDAVLLGAVLRALGILSGVSPYARLEPGLAESTFGALYRKFERLMDRSLEHSGKEMSSEDFSVLQNVTNCLSLLISKGEVAAKGSPDSLKKCVSVMASITCSGSYPPGVRLDASIGLHRFAKALPVLAAPYAGLLQSAITGFLREDQEAVQDAGKPSFGEKICQQEIRALAEVLHVPASEAGPMVGFCEEVMAEGIDSGLPLVRSAVLQSMTHLKSDLAREVDSNKLSFLVSKVCHFAGEISGSSIGTRSSACRALGALLSLEPVLSLFDSFEYGLVTLISLGSADSGTLQVSLAWSLANVCDVLREQTQSGKGLPAALAKCVAKHLPSISALTIRLAGCNDKIRCNAVRCIGYIFDLFSALGADMEEDFESKAVDCMLGSLWKGNTKVQWNCCYAAGSFFRLSGGTAEEGELRGKLLDAVTSLMRSSTNYKVLSHAITALRQLEWKAYLAGAMAQVCESLVHVLLLLDRQKAPQLKEEELKEIAVDFLVSCVEEGGADDPGVVAVLEGEIDWLCTISEKLSSCLRRLA